MGWFTKSKKKPATEPATKEELWIQCPKCTAHVFREEWDKGFKVCPQCNFHERLSCRERVKLLIDEGTFEELDPGITFADPLKFSDASGTYATKAAETRTKTGLNEAVLTGRGKINGLKVVVAVMDFKFLGGSLGSGTGEKIARAARYALSHKLPYIIVSASGGARMHEGIVSLMQMPKTCAAIARLHQAGVPYVSIMTDPTTGGVSASYAMVGDIHISEPGAMIGFAGRRVIEQTIKQKLPDSFQTAEYLVEHGFVDLIVQRKDLKDQLHRILQYCVHR